MIILNYKLPIKKQNLTKDFRLFYKHNLERDNYISLSTSERI